MNLPDLSQHAGIRLDCETDGLRWFDGARPVGFSWLLPGTGERGYAAFGHDSGNNCTPEEAREWARRELRGKHICNAKTKFDIHMIREFGADLAEQGCTFSDVAYNAALLDDNRYEFNVDILARDFLPEGTAGKLTELGGVAIDKTRIKSYPGHVLAPYAIRDVELVDLLDVETLRRIREEDLLRVYDLENSVIPVVCEMERNAAPLDLDLLNTWEKETFDELRAACWKIYRATGVRFECERETLFGTQPIDPKFPVAEKRRLFKIRGVPIPVNKELDGERITEKESFEDDLLAPIDDEIIRTFRYALQLQSLRAKYIVKYKNVVGRDGLLRYELNQLACGDEESKGTVSGRFSSSGGDKRDPFGVNIQQVFSLDNQAKTLVNRWVIRKLFKPAIGSWFRADAKQIEYRLFAHYANSPKINAVYARDPEADFHQTVCDLLNTVIEINRKHTKNVNFACCASETPILRADLKWIAAGSLQAGDKVLAFDEDLQKEGRGRERSRRWRVATVTDNRVEPRECVEVVTNNRAVICTLDHRWLVRDSHSANRNLWKRADELTSKDKIVEATNGVWEQDTSYESGWLAGLFDGEGWAGKHCVAMNQNPGAVFDRAEHVARERFHVNLHNDNGSSSTKQLTLAGSASDRLAFLGQVRPERLIPAFVNRLAGQVFQRAGITQVISVRRVGQRDVAILNTSTRTYIAQGFASHNCVFGAGMGKFAEMCGLVDGYGWQEATFGSQTRRWFGPIPSKRAVELYQAYMGMFPEVKPLLRKAAKLVETRGYVKTAMGRRARCYKKPHSGLNRVIQGTAASINKKKLRRVYDERKNLEFTMRFTVHDELNGDLRNPEKFDALTAILNEQDFVEFQNRSTGRRETSRIPILWDSATAGNWADAS